MLLALSVVVMLSAPPTQAHCVDAWPKATSPAKEVTQGCIDLLLKTAYGPKVDAEALSLDPGYGHPIELELTGEELKAIARHVSAVCPGEGDDWRCTRASEYVEGMAGRKMSLFESAVMDDFAGALQTVLRGEALGKGDLCPSEPACYTPLTLWKLRNASYARHGYKFEKEDLNRFFYDPRPDGIGQTSTEVPSNLLPLPRGESKDVKLTPVDQKNVKLIQEAEKRALSRSR